VIFGGGVSLSGDLLLDPVKNSISRHIMDGSYLDGLVVTTAKLGDDAGLFGSLAQAHIKLAEH
jgi:glucokinase